MKALNIKKRKKKTTCNKINYEHDDHNVFTGHIWKLKICPLSATCILSTIAFIGVFIIGV